jgi:hypothetical protein
VTRSRHVFLLVIITAAVLLGGAAAVVTLHTGEAPSPELPSGGPLSCRACDYVGIGVPESPGVTFTFGHLSFLNRGHRPAVLLNVSLRHASPAIHLVKVFAVLSQESPNGLTGTAARFPPSGLPERALHPFDGWRVPPDPSGNGPLTQALMGLRVNRTGQYTFRAVVLRYRVGATVYRDVFPYALRVCLPAKEYVHGQSCPLP